MSHIVAPIEDHEVAWACALMGLPENAFAGADGGDPRLKVLKEMATLDIEACPGSGKTTLLVAKLAILASRWTPRRQGICVLSHTNAARNEIGGRLSTSSAGHALLRYPHFVGTIHSFVNEFLAIPWLRSKGNPLKAIDTDIALRTRWSKLPYGTKSYLEQKGRKPSALSYETADYGGGGKTAFGAHTATHQEMVKVCKTTSEQGLFCYDEMFVWATELLDRRPEVRRSLRERFPLVFIDEVQDNSELQSAFLHRLFLEGESPSIRQRFGDSNQAIFRSINDDAGATTDRFPGAAKVDLPNSFRFGRSIADVANPLGIVPQSLVGLGPTRGSIGSPAKPNVLFLFDEGAVLEVLPAFAEHLVRSFSETELSGGQFVAVAGVHRSEDPKNVPHILGHYAPAYRPAIASKEPNPATVSDYLARARADLTTTSGSHPVTTRLSEAVIRYCRLAGTDLPFAIRASPHRFVLERLEKSPARDTYLTLIDYLIRCRCGLTRLYWEATARQQFADVGAAVADQPINQPECVKFLEWVDLADPAASGGGQSATSNIFSYPSAEPKVHVRLGSVHSVKGETHTATLVLESFFHDHHLLKLKPWLLGAKPPAGKDNAKEKVRMAGRLKLHYVAMTRPSHMLCLAMRSDAFTPAELDIMTGRGWTVIECKAAAV